MTDRWDDATESAWAAFRARLADRLAGLDLGEGVTLALGTGADAADDAAPYLEVWRDEDDLLRASVETLSAAARSRLLAPESVDRLHALGWPSPDRRHHRAEAVFPLRAADRVAVECVALLRGLCGCPHPAFLDPDELDWLEDRAAGTRPDPEPVADDPADDPTDALEPLATVPDDGEHLQRLVDAALARMFGRPVRHDRDGDVPIVCERSVLYVRVDREHPVVRLYAELVVGVADVEQAAREVGVLNRRYEHAKFYLRDREVVLEQRLGGSPFAPAQLRAAVARVCDDLDRLASDLVARVGGARYLDDAPTRPEPPRPAADAAARPDDAHPGMVALLELLHEGGVPVPVVADLFDGRRLELVRQLVRVRTGQQPLDGHDPETVLRHLRLALRHVVDGADGRVPPRPRPGGTSRQLPLLPEPDQPLPLGSDQE